MDPISAIIVAAAVVSFITSTSALVSSTALIYERSAESAPMLDRVSRELEIFSQIMRDVEGVLAEGGSVLDPGSGLMVALKNTCSEVRNKFYYVADILERFLRERRGRTLFSSLRVAFLFINRRDDLMFHYQSLRDSASLARDLASE